MGSVHLWEMKMNHGTDPGLDARVLCLGMGRSARFVGAA